MLSFITWDVDPDAFSVFGREIRWYGILWATGVMCTAAILQRIYKHEKLSENLYDSLFIYVITGLIIGARLGHCLFYNPIEYLSHPLTILKVWEGGLSSHGGAIGMGIAVFLYSRNVVKKSMIWTLDRLIIGVAIGATSIRLGNLMNSEIYGGPTTLPWGFNFVKDDQWSLPLSLGGSGSLPCHPTQLYEALIYFVIFILGLYLFYKTKAKEKQGLIIGVSLIGIFLSRFCIEFIKNIQEKFEVDMIATYGINMGQLLSLPFVFWGIWLVWNALRQKEPVVKPNNIKK